MQKIKLQEMQNFLLETITLNPNINLESQLNKPQANDLFEATRHRVQAYRTSYYLRVSFILMDCLFYPACRLIDKEYIVNLLVEFFSTLQSPKDVINAARGFPLFLKKHKSLEEFPFAPDLMQLCINQYDILTAKDPNPDFFITETTQIINPQNIYLQKDHIFMESQWPIFSFFEFSMNPRQQSKIVYSQEKILLIKSSSFSLEGIFIPSNYAQIIVSLSKGSALSAAIEDFEIEENSFDGVHFSDWIFQLTKRKALVKI